MLQWDHFRRVETLRIVDEKRHLGKKSPFNEAIRLSDNVSLCRERNPWRSMKRGCKPTAGKLGNPPIGAEDAFTCNPAGHWTRMK